MLSLILFQSCSRIRPFGLRSRTPAPPPFSGMNSTPAFSRAPLTSASVRGYGAPAPRSRAIAILKAKNRLPVDDAKRVEVAFASRIAQQEPPLQPLTVDELAPTPTDSASTQLPAASTAAIKRLRGRPRKVRAATEQTAPPPVASEPTVDDNLSASAPLQSDTAPAKIDKSLLTISEPRRHRDKAHLKFVASHPCLIRGRSPADAHHLKFTQPRAMGRKVSDEFTVPLCRIHHRDLHSVGDEIAWWERRAVDPIATARVLWVSTRRIE
jgi:hypothetical protein